MVASQLQPQPPLVEQRQQRATADTPARQVTRPQRWFADRRVDKDGVEPIARRPDDPRLSFSQEMVVADDQPAHREGRPVGDGNRRQGDALVVRYGGLGRLGGGPTATQGFEQIIDRVEQPARPVALQDQAAFIWGAEKAVTGGAVAQGEAGFRRSGNHRERRRTQQREMRLEFCGGEPGGWASSVKLKRPRRGKGQFHAAIIREGG